MDLAKRIPATITLLVINCLVFAWTYFKFGTSDESLWGLELLNHGALYNPFVLDGQWYRLFTHLFLHGGILHLAFNMYALFTIGNDIEEHVGSRRFLAVYFIGGVGAALTSLYVNLFQIGVGASGAIFALFGFALVVNIVRYREHVRALLVNFAMFLFINLLMATALHADNAAHLGGAACGLIIGGLSVLLPASLAVEGISAALVIVMFFSLPRYQVRYFRFFQKVLQAQDSSNYVLNNSTLKANDDFLKEYRRATAKWDTAMNMLNTQSYIPEELRSDTFKLRRLIKYHKAETDYRIAMVENERYIYSDSIEIALDSLRRFTKLDFVLNLKYMPKDTVHREQPPPLKETRIWYDSNWVEIPYPPAEYFRVGQRDTAGLWQGALADFFKSGQMQMKGSYQNDMKDGIFIYYTKNGKYSAAGVYNDDQRVGKWETFHPNGKIESEVYYRDRYFLKSYWDSTGVQMVKDGYGREIHRYKNGVIASEGEYVDGFQEGYWYGRHENGQIYFEENYSHGRLINGRSKSKTGRTVVYDETVFFALPEGGYKDFNKYIRSTVKDPKGVGTVKLSFRVTVSGQITDFKVEQSVSKELDMRAKQIILSGPRWLPAKLHGLEPTDGYGFVAIEF
jgi:membrane associated rhomboid family serine protease/antitoxin component YwqK of YwqJK toxin-antitoxin module